MLGSLRSALLNISSICGLALGSGLTCRSITTRQRSASAVPEARLTLPSPAEAGAGAAIAL